MSVTTDYTITAADLPNVRSWLAFQNAFGAGMKQVSTADIPNYLGATNYLSGAYPALQNASIKAWIDQFFSFMTTTDEAAKMYLVWQYLVFCTNNYLQAAPAESHDSEGQYMDWVSYWNVFAITKTWSWKTPWYESDDYSCWNSSLSVPGAPASWSSKINTVLTQWGANPPADYINQGPTNDSKADVMSFENSVFAKWSGFTSLVASTAPVWKAQSDAVRTMWQQPSLSPNQYVFLLHLLIGLGTSNTNDQQLALKIVNTPTSSLEYPNDTFINQVIYASLMYFNDPLGDFCYTNSQLQGLLTDTNNLIVSNDPASAAMRQSIANQIKILHSDVSYPMQDPYNPGYGVNTRMSDTLAALDGARSIVSLV